jgi:receptor-type tyrosine-protein phosphatase gamma
VKNPIGMGPPTKVIVMTDEGVPSPPVNLTVLRMTDVDVDLVWNPPLMPNGVIEGYRV